MKFTMECTFKKHDVDKIIAKHNLAEGGKVQKVVDNEVVKELGKRVPRDTGTEQNSIRGTTTLGSGIVRVSTPYAHYQDEHNKGSGMRGAHAFERMKAGCKDTILRAAAKI